MEALQRIEQLNILLSHIIVWVTVLTILVITYELLNRGNADD